MPDSLSLPQQPTRLANTFLAVPRAGNGKRQAGLLGVEEEGGTVGGEGSAGEFGFQLAGREDERVAVRGNTDDAGGLGASVFLNRQLVPGSDGQVVGVFDQLRIVRRDEESSAPGDVASPLSSSLFKRGRSLRDCVLWMSGPQIAATTQLAATRVSGDDPAQRLRFSIELQSLLRSVMCFPCPPAAFAPARDRLDETGCVWAGCRRWGSD